MNAKYILYARKSTDAEDKQVLSIEAQLVELRNFAKQDNLQVIDELIEKQSAKIPGRPIFGQLLKRIEAGEVSGILAWHPDRLARNSIDGGQIVYLLDQTCLTNLKFPTFWFENTSQGKFMLSIAFGQSKYYVDNLAENTKRGLRQKVRRGEYPSKAPLGYINDLRTKSIVVDKRLAPIVRQAFELYAKNNSTYEDISDFFAMHGMKPNGKTAKFKKDRIRRILANPFYYGHFLYTGEMYEGKHEPIISKNLFDKVQVVLAERGRPRKANYTVPKAFCGLFRCGQCGLAITGEKRVKRQKNGNVHEYIYYHCTRKRKDIICINPAVREESLDESLCRLASEYAMPKSWADGLLERIAKDEANESNSVRAIVREAQNKIIYLQSKLQRLLDSYLDQDIDRETYQTKKSELMSDKRSLEEKVAVLTHNNLVWVEPMKNWIETAASICEITKNDDLLAKKSLALEIFGSNLILQNKQARLGAPKAAFPLMKNRWVLLCKTIISQTKTGAPRPNLSKSCNLARLYRDVRTEFEREM